MGSILDEIIGHKRREVSERKELYPTKLLEKSIYFESVPLSLRGYLRKPGASGVIAEIKRASPSKGDINPHISVESLSVGYMQSGASALSVLTDTRFFKGALEDLRTARRFNLCPILRKDFIIDPYQVIEAKSAGADVVLLIAAALKPDELQELAKEARGLGMEVLMEVHNSMELDTHLCPAVSLVGVNNRNLKTFTVDAQVSHELAGRIPGEFVKVSESGIFDVQLLTQLRRAGYEGFLIGEAFMSRSKPAMACRKFIEELRRAE